MEASTISVRSFSTDWKEINEVLYLRGNGKIKGGENGWGEGEFVAGTVGWMRLLGTVMGEGGTDGAKLSTTKSFYCLLYEILVYLQTNGLCVADFPKQMPRCVYSSRTSVGLTWRAFGWNN